MNGANSQSCPRQREEIEWCQIYWFDTSNPEKLPRVLLIGDSIVAGSRDAVAHELKDVAVVAAYSTSKIVGDPAMYRELTLALSDYPIDLVYFNNGLHGLDFDDDTYRRGLEETVRFLLANSKARLVWRNTTPITVRDCPEQKDVRNEIVCRRNRIAAQVMQQHGIMVDDLYAALEHRPDLSSGDGFHYNPAGNQAIGRHCAKFIRSLLDK